MKKVIAIGDVHGRRNWKEIVRKNKGSRFVFLGDYCDPYSEMSNYEVLDNLLDIIAFKNHNRKDVILLLGNHDMHYLYPNFPKGSRWNPQIAQGISALFHDYRDLFQFAYQDGRTLYTHAGVSQSWWDNDFLPHVDKTQMHYSDKGILDVASLLNNATGKQLDAMYQVGYYRGGVEDNGGIFWADKEETSTDPLQGFHQVVGHTQVPAIHTYSTDPETIITYCDCLRTGVYHWKPEGV